MITLLLSLALALALLGTLRPALRRLTLPSTLFASAILAVFGCGPGTTWLVSHVQQLAPERPDQLQWRTRNAIIVLGVGVQRSSSMATISPNPASYGRLLEAYRLYAECIASGSRCTLYLSGGDPEFTGRSEASVYADMLQGLGVPPHQLVIEGTSRNTWENAKNTTALLADTPDAMRVLVTSRIHLYRSMRYFQHFGTTTIGWWSDDLAVPFSIVPSALNLALADVALNELVGLARYSLYTSLGLNE